MSLAVVEPDVQGDGRRRQIDGRTRRPPLPKPHRSRTTASATHPRKLSSPCGGLPASTKSLHHRPIASSLPHLSCALHCELVSELISGWRTPHPRRKTPSLIRFREGSRCFCLHRIGGDGGLSVVPEDGLCKHRGARRCGLEALRCEDPHCGLFPLVF